MLSSGITSTLETSHSDRIDKEQAIEAALGTKILSKPLDKSSSSNIQQQAEAKEGEPNK